MPAFRRVTPRLPVPDLARTVAFYTDLLGFAVDVSWPEDGPATFCTLQRDDISLGFFVADEQRPTVVVGTGELYLETTGVRELHAALAGRVAVEWGPEVYFYGRREFAVRDPAGYLVIVTEPTDDPPTCPGP